MKKFFCDTCKDVFESDNKRPRDCPHCRSRYVHPLPERPKNKYFFYECLVCINRFLVVDQPAIECPKCISQNLKRIAQEKVYICNHCGFIMFTQGHIDSHYCIQKDRGEYWHDRI